MLNGFIMNAQKIIEYFSFVMMPLVFQGFNWPLPWLQLESALPEYRDSLIYCKLMAQFSDNHHHKKQSQDVSVDIRRDRKPGGKIRD
jgi:hypothetical protein